MSNTASQGSNVSVLRELVVREKEHMRSWLDAEILDRGSLQLDHHSLAELIFRRLETRLTAETNNVKQSVQSNSSLQNPIQRPIERPIEHTTKTTANCMSDEARIELENKCLSDPAQVNKEIEKERDLAFQKNLVPVPNEQSEDVDVNEEEEEEGDDDDDDDDNDNDYANEDTLNEESNESSDEEEYVPVRKKSRMCPTNQTFSTERQLRTRKSPRFAQNETNHQTEHKSRTNSSETVNHSNKKYLTLSLRCHQLGCDKEFVQPCAIDKLNAHMFVEHEIDQHRCLVPECGQSFDKPMTISAHMKTVHGGATAPWSCGKCDKHYSTYYRLLKHNSRQHHLGQFQCSNAKCTFIGDNKAKITKHLTHCKHRPEKWHCHRAGCAFRSKCKNLLDLHEKEHLGIKPYRCKWPGCGFASALQGWAMQHIGTHLKRKPSTSLDKAEDYLEVINHSKKRPKQRSQTTDDHKSHSNSTNEGTSVVDQAVNHFVTISLQCHQLGCEKVFVQPDVVHKLNQHMLKKHSIGPFRCVMKDCGQTFDNSCILGNHVKKAHRRRNSTRWFCGKCDKHYLSHERLSHHNSSMHHLGNYQCSYCTFTSKIKRNIYHHFEAMHKAELQCKWRGCAYRHRNPQQLAAHERSHRGAKPYQCKWPNCLYASASRTNTMSHIRKIHLMTFNRPESSQNGRNQKQRKAEDYLRVICRLLEDDEISDSE